MKRRRFVHPGARPGARLELTPEDLRHAASVLRLKPGARLEVVDGAGGRFAATYTGAAAPQLEVGESLEQGPAAAARESGLTVGLASVKSARMDWAVEKLSELGVDVLVPLLTARGVNPPRMERLRRIARESAKQCGRASLLAVQDAAGLEGFAAGLAPGAGRLLLDPAAAPLLAGDVVTGTPVGLAIGPEGGFTEEERRLALGSLGFRPVRVPGLLLRAETAAVAGAVSVLALRAASTPR